MDFISSLPPEISCLILKCLPPEDLWTCLSVNQKWRQIANCDFLWEKHLKDYEFPSYFLVFDEDANNSFELCFSARKWMVMAKTLNNWKNGTFKGFPFSETVKKPIFYCHGNTVLAFEASKTIKKMKVFSLEDNELALISTISLPRGLFFTNNEDYEFAELYFTDVQLSPEYIIYRTINVILVYRKTTTFSFYKLYYLNNQGEIVTHTSLPEHLYSTSNEEQISLSYSHIYQDKLWIAWCYNSVDIIYLIDLTSSEIKKLTAPCSEQLICLCTSSKDRIVLEYESKIAVYDLNGNVLFIKEIEEDYLAVRTNGKIITVFTPYSVMVLNANSGELEGEIQNEYFTPSNFSLHPNKNFFFLIKKLPLNDIQLLGFNLSTSWEPIWRRTINLSSYSTLIDGGCCYLFGVFLILTIEHFSLLMDSPLSVLTTVHPKSSFSHELLFIDIRTGKIVFSGVFYDLQFTSERYLIAGNESFTLYSAM